MKKITNLIIIDASGSMASKADEVKGGLKQLFKDIASDKETKALKQRTVIIDFSGAGDVRTLIDSEDTPKDSIANDYTTRGMTALYDAIGYGFSLVAKEKNVFVSILTDGDENDSKEYKYSAIKDLMENKRKNAKGWVITFMGTTEESIAKAQSMGISIGNTMWFSNSDMGVNKAMKMSNRSRAMYTSFVANDSFLDTTNLMATAEEEVTKD